MFSAYANLREELTMSRISYILVFFVSLSLVACTSNEKKPPEIREEFATKIEKNGLKLFTYTVTMAMPEDRSGGMRGGMEGGGGMRGGGMGGGGMRGGGMKNGAKSDREATMNRFQDIVYEKLKTKLSETGYCRDSYTEINKYFLRGRSQIRGECNESATEEDRMTFINDENV